MLEATCAYDVRLVCVSDLLRTYSTTFARNRLIATYTTCALEATCAYNVRLVRVSNLLRTYGTAFARKRLVHTKYDFCA